MLSPSSHAGQGGGHVSPSSRLSRIIHDVLIGNDTDEVPRSFLFGTYNLKARRELSAILEQLPALSISDGRLDVLSQRVIDTDDTTQKIYRIAELVGRMRLHQLYEEVKIMP